MCSTRQYEKEAVVLREKFLVEKSKYEASKPPATEPVGKAMSKDKAGGKDTKDTKDKPKPPKVLSPPQPHDACGASAYLATHRYVCAALALLALRKGARPTY
ncbi:MAG: hypothetical protein ACK55Z_32710 [bacterium]